MKTEAYFSLVVICFQISIFEPLETTRSWIWGTIYQLWFAFKLVSLNHWKQPHHQGIAGWIVVICFQISIFEPLETSPRYEVTLLIPLWFAFKLVSLNHWKQRRPCTIKDHGVVICFQISIFEPLETTEARVIAVLAKLWFAFKLVSLNHWKQLP